MLLSGGLTIHNLGDRTCFHETQADEIYKQFDDAVTQAVKISDVSGSFRRDCLGNVNLKAKASLSDYPKYSSD